MAQVDGNVRAPQHQHARAQRQRVNPGHQSGAGPEQPARLEVEGGRPTQPIRGDERLLVVRVENLGDSGPGFEGSADLGDGLIPGGGEEVVEVAAGVE